MSEILADGSAGIREPKPMTLAERDAADLIWEHAPWASRIWHDAADRIWERDLASMRGGGGR